MASNPTISIVVSIGNNREIGKDNDLLWDIPEDRKRFKEITMGHVVIWGRKTFESVLSYIHKAPPGRTNIIVTRDNNFKFEDCIVAHSFEEALEKAKEIELKNYSSSDPEPVDGESRSSRQARTIEPEIFIGGGGQIYHQAMDAGIVDRLYLTIVEGEYESDTFFPDYAKAGFKIVSEEEQDNGRYKFKWLTLEKI